MELNQSPRKYLLFVVVVFFFLFRFLGLFNSQIGIGSVYFGVTAYILRGLSLI